MARKGNGKGQRAKVNERGEGRRIELMGEFSSLALARINTPVG